MREGMNPKAYGRTEASSRPLSQLAPTVWPSFLPHRCMYGVGGANGCSDPTDFVAPVLVVALANLLPQVSTKSRLVFQAMDNKRLL